jgi:hypothetical protein
VNRATKQTITRFVPRLVGATRESIALPLALFLGSGLILDHSIQLLGVSYNQSLTYRITPYLKSQGISFDPLLIRDYFSTGELTPEILTGGLSIP